MRFPKFSMTIKAMISDLFSRKYAMYIPQMARIGPTTLTNGPRKNCGTAIPVWRPPKIPAILTQLFQKLKSVISAFYNAVLVYQNGRACITKFRRLLI